MNTTDPLYNIQIVKSENILYPYEAVIFHNGERLDPVSARSIAGLLGRTRDAILDNAKTAGTKPSTKPAKKPKAPAAPAVANDNETTIQTLDEASGD